MSGRSGLGLHERKNRIFLPPEFYFVVTLYMESTRLKSLYSRTEFCPWYTDSQDSNGTSKIMQINVMTYDLESLNLHTIHTRESSLDSILPPRQKFL